MTGLLFPLFTKETNFASRSSGATDIARVLISSSADNPPSSIVATALNVLPMAAEIATAAAHGNCQLAAFIATGWIFAPLFEFRFKSSAVSPNELVQLFNESIPSVVLFEVGRKMVLSIQFPCDHLCLNGGTRMSYCRKPFLAIALLIAGVAQATLVGRDINGMATSNSNAVFLWDSDRNITWLRNANAGAGSIYDDGGPFSTTNDGLMTWTNAVSWVSNLTVGSFAGWRLPSTMHPDATCSNSLDADFPFGIQSFGINCTDSAMGHLWYTELGNVEGSLTNTGNFQNLLSYAYWSGTEYAPNPSLAWRFGSFNGGQDAALKTSQFYAMAVRDGDVASIPEPPTLALLALGLAGIGWSRRKASLI